ncbi:MAG: hypothetical protein KAR79_01195, partial [Simkaniaceae bacterium]|nr:hypothetical protein [Simkaniaceae bacterium]
MTFEIQNLTKYTQLQNCFLQNSFKKPLPRSASTSKSTLYSRKCKRVKKKFRRFEVESANNYNFDTKDFVDCTPEFTYQPPLYFWQMHPLIDHQKNTFIPSYLIKERVKEKLTPLKNKSAILKYAKIHLTESAVLKRSQCGFIYLDLNDSALFSLLQFVEEIGIEIPSFLEEKEKI